MNWSYGPGQTSSSRFQKFAACWLNLYLERKKSCKQGWMGYYTIISVSIRKKSKTITSTLMSSMYVCVQSAYLLVVMGNSLMLIFSSVLATLLYIPVLLLLLLLFVAAQLSRNVMQHRRPFAHLLTMTRKLPTVTLKLTSNCHPNKS